jgi:hypothetical protein
MKLIVFWNVAPCILVVDLMMDATGTSETSAAFYQTTRRNVPEVSHLKQVPAKRRALSFYWDFIGYESLPEISLLIVIFPSSFPSLIRHNTGTFFLVFVGILYHTVHFQFGTTLFLQLIQNRKVTD